mmetsp:Transcript_6204/g.10285  ORF Transcript_6204/g.10285 Transcript_6204/m.10285 type:complete len:92 (+) Transcript_6204:236-511(+)
MDCNEEVTASSYSTRRTRDELTRSSRKGVGYCCVQLCWHCSSTKACISKVLISGTMPTDDTHEADDESETEFDLSPESQFSTTTGVTDASS